MARKKPKKEPIVPSKPVLDAGPLEYNPFLSLKGIIREEKVEPAPPPPPPPLENRPPPPPEDESDDDLFQSAMTDVAKVEWKKQRAVLGAPELKPVRPGRAYAEDLEVLAQLEDLVAGRAQFDLFFSDEYLEGYVRGLNPIILEKIRRGRYSVQAYLDLHGLTVREAEEAVREFVAESLVLKYRCVLLVHGRGLNSKDQISVLKERLEAILLKGPVRKHILAFTSALPHDGGTGASYVLLRAKK
ncbi:MAG: Smr/MutS family protein [Pseudomonadota bacterium]